MTQTRQLARTARVVRKQFYGAYASGDAGREITDEMIALAKSRLGAERDSPPPSWDS